MLRPAIEYAIRQRLLTSNVMQDVDRPRRDPRRLRVWTAHQLGTFLAHAADDRLFPLLRVASHTGARRSELLGLRWTDLDLEARPMSVTSRRTRVGYTMVDRAGTKTTAGSRVVDLDPDTVAALKRWLDSHEAERRAWGEAYVVTGHVFTAENGEPVHADHVMQRFERLIAAARVPGIRFHDLRHTHATLLLKAGVPAHVVTQRLGHSSAAFTLSRYSHVLPRQQSEAAAAFAQLVNRSGRAEPPGEVPPAPCPGCGHDGVEWTAELHGSPAVLADDGAWFAHDFACAATAADLELTCDKCGWSKTIAAGEWETR